MQKKRRLTIVGKCRTRASEDFDGAPNITAWSSSIIVREKLSQGGGLAPFMEGDDH